MPRIGSDQLDVACSLFAALADHLKLDLLALAQHRNSSALERADMHEDILGAVIRLDDPMFSVKA